MNDCTICAGTGLLAPGVLKDECPLCGPGLTCQMQNLATGLVYTTNQAHSCRHGKHMLHLECPERVSKIMENLEQMGLRARCVEVPSCEVTSEDLLAMHSEGHAEAIVALEDLETQAAVDRVASNYESVYLTSSSSSCARIAAGSVVALMERVIKGEIANGFAVVRPPGHHAESNLCCGWCIFNNVAIAANVAKTKFGVDRVLIVDWDVHHGNGTQHLFEDDPSVLYFSVHRYDDGDFFPGSKDAAPHMVGCRAGEGFNVNVAWNLGWKDKRGMGDDEYLAAWQCVLLPIATQFQPQLILVSAGFDCAAGDLGGCSVTPAGFAQMTRMLQPLCSKIVLVLEGGYDLGVIPQCACACMKALLGDSLNLRTEVRPKKEARLSIERTLRAHQPFWNSLGGNDISELISTTAISLDVEVTAGLPNFSDDPIPKQKKGAGLHRGGREKPVTGVSIATRNAAISNWKSDTKKLSRKQAELNAVLKKIDTLKCSIGQGAKVSKKDYALLESEEDVIWQQKEITSELQELNLSQGDAIRMYIGRS